jgi:hypothetical protein
MKSYIMLNYPASMLGLCVLITCMLASVAGASSDGTLSEKYGAGNFHELDAADDVIFISGLHGSTTNLIEGPGANEILGRFSVVTSMTETGMFGNDKEGMSRISRIPAKIAFGLYLKSEGATIYSMKGLNLDLTRHARLYFVDKGKHESAYAVAIEGADGNESLVELDGARFVTEKVSAWSNPQMKIRYRRAGK